MLRVVKTEESKVPPPMPPPPINKALLRPNQGITVVNNPLMRPYFLGVKTDESNSPLKENRSHVLASSQPQEGLFERKGDFGIFPKVQGTTERFEKWGSCM